MKRIIGVLITALAAPMTAATGQALGLDRDLRSATWIDAARPAYNEDGLSTTLVFAGLRWQANGTLALKADVPLAMSSYSGFGSSASESGIGNPYLGLQWSPGASTTTELGVRLPLAKDAEANALAMLGDIDRLEAFLPDVMTVQAAYTGRFGREAGAFARVRLGGSGLFAMGDSDADPELFADFSGQVGWAGQHFEASAGVSGRMLVTEEGDFSERSLSQVMAAVTYRSSWLRPTLFVRMPLDSDVSEVFDYTVGLGVTVRLR